VQETVLLCEVTPEGPFDDDLTGRDRDEAGADGPHERLPVEARPNACLDLGVGRLIRQASTPYSAYPPTSIVCSAIFRRSENVFTRSSA
jgi:hypothetical protein